MNERDISAERLLALTHVWEERDRQIEKWGDQSDNTLPEWMSILGEEYGELCEASNETWFSNAVNKERGGFDKVMKEAIHVAAVAVSIIEASIKMER